MRAIACITLALFMAAPAVAACSGDCNGDGEVQINELVVGVGIALGQTPGTACPAIDGDGNGEVTIAELIGAANALLSGCPSETTPTAIVATATAPADTPTATPTATANQPPAFPSPSVYRGIAGQSIARPIDALDPEGDPVACAADALLAGMTLEDNILRWTPAEGQIGLFDVPVRCQDAADPPLTADGELDFRITPPDSCAPATCDPATGCSETVLPVSTPCCAGAAPERVPQAEVSCPQGRLLLLGRNASGFGALQSCDHLRFYQSAQTSAELRIHIRVSCLNPLNRVSVRAKLESPTRGVLVDALTNAFLPAQPTNGFYERRNVEFPFAQMGPFLNIEDTEANLTVTVRDSDGVQVATTVRVILTSHPMLLDLPDL